MFYVRVATRSSGAAAQGSPRQALGYLADNHDRERDAGCSEAEFNYIARLDPGWKTDLEGGRGPLVGYGTLKGVTEDQLVSRFEDACQPHHDTRGSTGYKSLTFTLPKEVSLFAEGHREEAKAAMHAAVQPALDRAFPGMRYSAAAAIHTRNTTGEIHYHVHVVVAKFAQTDKGRTVSLNSKAGGNGPLRLQQLKRGWKEGIEWEFRERLQLGIEQRAPNGPVTLVLPDRARLEPLNRNSRRLLEKEIAPRYTEPSPSGAAMVKQFRWSAMDDRIFEVASGDKGDVRWSRQAFAETFPEHASHISRYEARVRTLQAVGYLSPEGKVTPPFRVHFCVHHGVMSTLCSPNFRAVTAKQPIAITHTGEPHQPVRLYWRVKNRAAVLSVFRGLRCVWEDGDWAGRWIWLYDDEASSVPLPKRPDEVPEIYRPIVLAQISFPAADKMIMRFRAVERAIAATLFFAPRFGQNAVPDRFRILNRLVTAEEVQREAHYCDMLLDQNVTIIDPEVEIRRRDALLDAAPTVRERRRLYEQDARARRGLDVPEVEDFPLAMEEETETFTHLKATLRFRSVSAFERWSGKSVTLRDIIYRTLGVDPDAPLFPPEMT